MNEAHNYLLSIETEPGKSRMHGFHLGTNEAIARGLVEERFHARKAVGFPTITAALMLNGKIVDVYDGHWQSDWDKREEVERLAAREALEIAITTAQGQPGFAPGYAYIRNQTVLNLRKKHGIGLKVGQEAFDAVFVKVTA